MNLLSVLSFSAFGIGPSGVGSCSLDIYGQCWQFTGDQWTAKDAAEQCKNIGGHGGTFTPGKACPTSTLGDVCEHNPQGSAAYQIQILYYAPNFQMSSAVSACNGHSFNQWHPGW